MAGRLHTTEQGTFHPPDMIRLAQAQAGVTPAVSLESPALTALCASLEAAGADMPFAGRRRAQRMLLQTLVKRLRLGHYLDSQPDIGAITLTKPLLLVGPFRSGTTFAHRLLACDPANRTPRLWETLQAPPVTPEFRGDSTYFERDYRIDTVRQYLEARARFTPDLTSIHATDVNAPEECFGLLETSYLSHSFFFHAPVFDYLDWLDGCTGQQWHDAYQVYADQLRLLQWWAPGERWLLKSPFHLWSVDALCSHFPDAVIVQQHREPAACVASYCSLTAQALRPIAGHISREQIGRSALRFLRDALARNVKARQTGCGVTFLDIDYRDLIANPIECAKRVYAAADIPLSGAVEARMRQWLQLQAQARSGAKRHNYELAEFGLDIDEVNEAFRQYEQLR